MIYKVVWVSSVHQSDSVIHIHILLFFRFFSHMLLQNIELTFLSMVGGGVVTKSCTTFVTAWTAACQAPLSMGFSRQEYWSGSPFPSPGDLSDPGIKPVCLHCRRILYWPSYKGSHRGNEPACQNWRQEMWVGMRDDPCNKNVGYRIFLWWQKRSKIDLIIFPGAQNYLLNLLVKFDNG